MLGSNVISIDQSALRLSDVEAGMKFFNETLGFKVNFSLQYDGFRVIMLQAGKTAIEMWESRERKAEDDFLLIKEDNWVSTVEITVKNISTVLNQVNRSGYKVVDYVYDQDGIKEATVIGPDNIKVQFVEKNMLRTISEKLMEKVKLRYN